MNNYLPYNPGVLPTKEPPKTGEKIILKVEGVPPIKKPGISLRNPKNPRYGNFIALRDAAIKAMNGRAWYFGAIELDLIIYNKEGLNRANFVEYIGGVMDTLDGSRGVHFTYLPIMYEDDCQVCKSNYSYQESANPWYELVVRFV